ncbi:hypothetical protein KQY10_12055 [Leptospira interrogans]|uniref:HEAT repeat domain-containing protein n=1 Tax=Leptospira interrogans serovar Hardjo str. Norma TaxID=1279460 RepID=A0A0M4NUZ5_LEPIR|nr:hypothetical protein [Leptospira interrogans]ALE38737.1 hypothetical protein G436_1542 [Leptospira interrogans serovar Hardjo str. Norma]ALN99985.1 hypothetical protein LIH_06435 [Leptospira interrogans serovar Hardjo-prajitno]EKO95515.1 hypothetical protein LEP1GSC057_1007 [Leptospira interrogans str. Brem 329]EMN52244.1 hypothetical protein LEP1GSC089_0937 [Leptospira interrogans serovar Autumnalis str. LP101]EMN81280.1 hypothetical protein LEP1GSC106_2616 [Leptospira interrogans serovar 
MQAATWNNTLLPSSFFDTSILNQLIPVNYKTLASEYSHRETFNLSNDITEHYIAVNSDDNIEYLIKNATHSSAAKIHSVLSKSILNEQTFNHCINKLRSFENETQLDLLIFLISKHPNPYFEKVISYASNESIDKYVRYYLIEAIGKWGSIDEDNRKEALANILKNTQNNYIKIVVQNTMEEI